MSDKTEKTAEVLASLAMRILASPKLSAYMDHSSMAMGRETMYWKDKCQNSLDMAGVLYGYALEKARDRFDD